MRTCKAVRPASTTPRFKDNPHRPLPHAHSMPLRPTALACALALAPWLAQAADAPAASESAAAAPVPPVVQLRVDVPPYYIAARAPGEAPRVAVDPDVDALLSSVNAADILKARDAIAAQPDLVKPQTMIVLAMRLYDIGDRHDAVFWYYAGRDRFATMQRVLDMRSLQLIRSAEVVEAFEHAAGPAMDGFAYCSIAYQAEREDRALDWVAAHPYKILGFTELPAQTEDRNAALAAAVNHLREAAQKKKATFANPAALKEVADARLAAHAHERYCWR